ncbi:transcriptional regulator [Alteromonas sp. RW2A1]|jgi:transcriptional regulator with XRE-family HTH domain|uniref:helix-turn-helix domain-containing protein n=1 Tax=Alteromonas sp. RW2A1 TaxID=1917158 RepID=UPI00090307A8|nr:helix-turn-helix transcriptional regulator [Alteromonas sp. RW2A1]APE04642.1 transcriptional regulator [Alteromonas sp. RW2A1]
MSSLLSALGKQIRLARKSAGLSQEALALKAKLDRSYMGRIERGEANITVELLYQIAIAIGVTPKDLLPSTQYAKE